MTERDVMRSTLKHVQRVREFLSYCSDELTQRIIHHDDTKFGPDEFDAFVIATPKLAGLTYGSDEYRQSLRDIQPAINHHNACNSHHPEHYGYAGIKGMNLIDLLEMICDWRAATERHDDGDIRKSIEQNQERFGYSDDVKVLLNNTADFLEATDD